MKAPSNLPSLSGLRVLVVGDIMLDRYWSGPARRVSQEAPVPVIDVERTDDRPGGAANVALNVVSLGAECTLVGAVGDDEAGHSLRALLEAAGVRCDLVVVPGWPTITKLRILSQKQQLLRADFEMPLPGEHAGAVVEHFARQAPEAQAVVLQDYDKGAVPDPRQLLAAAVSPVVVDPKGKAFGAYRGASLLKPNASELALAAGPWADATALRARAEAVCRDAGVAAVAVTLGGDGMTVVQESGEHAHLPALPVDVYDVTGAGDTAAAVFGVTAALGMTAIDGARFANAAAGLVVAKSGTATVSGPELARALPSDASGDRGVMTREQLEEAVLGARQDGERIVFTNGCFDILHAGHVAYLDEARRLGDRLIVAVNDDDSVRRLKGEGRPVNPLEQRLRVLAGLESVDWVVSFPDDTPEPLLRALAPDVLAKGGDYRLEEVVGAEIVRAAGGEVRVLALTEDCSTTAILERLQED